jgi:hypothetical protein
LVFEIVARLVFRLHLGSAATAEELAEEVAKVSATRASSTTEIKPAKVEIHPSVAGFRAGPRAGPWEVVAVKAVLVVHLPLLGI